MFGINPGYSRKNNPVEDMEARKSWDDYQNQTLVSITYRHSTKTPAGDVPLSSLASKAFLTKSIGLSAP